MPTTLIITDLTRMSGDRVCVTSVTQDGRTIRPEFEQGAVRKSWLYETAE